MLGVILVGFVLLLPKGIVPTLRDGLLRIGRMGGARGEAKALGVEPQAVGAK